MLNIELLLDFCHKIFLVWHQGGHNWEKISPHIIGYLVAWKIGLKLLAWPGLQDWNCPI